MLTHLLFLDFLFDEHINKLATNPFMYMERRDPA